MKLFKAQVSEFDCRKCALAKKMMEDPEILSQEDLEWAIEREMFTERYCPEGCNKPTRLRFQDNIDLKDGLTVNGMPALIDINPSFILSDTALNEWFKFCSYADNGLFPNQGGALDQDIEFLEFYEIYCSWKQVTKSPTTQEG